MSGYSEDHLVEQPAIQFMQHELGWEEDGILNFGCWILNGRGRRQSVLRLNPALSLKAGLICWPVKFLDTLRKPAP